jgi:hypothetical protein
MKKIVYKGLYAIVLNLTNRFNIRLLSVLKIFLGTTLLVLMSSCMKKEKEEEPGPTCYLPPPPQEIVKPEPAQSASTSGAF